MYARHSGGKSPSLSTIMDLAETLGIPASQLVEHTEEILSSKSDDEDGKAPPV